MIQVTRFYCRINTGNGSHITQSLSHNIAKISRQIEFQRVHRLGKPNAGARPRPIIARFLRYGDKQLVMDRARKYLKNTAFNVYDDILKPLYDSRKGQLKKLHEAREKGYTAFIQINCLSMESTLSV